MQRRRQCVCLVLALLLARPWAAAAAPPPPPTCLASADAQQLEQALPGVLQHAASRLRAALRAFPPGGAAFPLQTLPSGQWSRAGVNGWVAGFLPGCLYKMAELTGDASWAASAAAMLPVIEPQQHMTWTHDIGFLMLPSVGLALEAAPAGSPQAARHRQVLLASAASLARRFSPRVGCIRSHGDIGARRFEVIIDNMMNLQLLLAAAALPGGDPAWRAMAAQHANTTAREHVRPDGSTFQMVVFDAVTGAVTGKETRQGLSRDSTWTRGQAWAIYGFTQAFQATRQPLFLQTAQRAADRFLARLPADGVPPWDFDAKPASAWKDTSSGAIAAAGLLRLADAVGAPAAAQRYRAAAARMLRQLATAYLSSRATPPQPASILRNGTANAAKGNLGTGLIYGDCYFLEALAHWRRLRC